MKISVCGKGGSGKSTLSVMMAEHAVARGFKALVVDSDESNSGLYRILGFEKPPTPLMEMVGGKKSIKKKMNQSNLFNQEFIFTKNIPPENIFSRDGLMLVSIGKILQALEGCACPMGVLNREFLKKLRLDENEIAIIDMEAGVEHFGRGVDTNIDAVLITVEPSFESIAIAGKIKEFAAGMDRQFWAVLNKIKSNKMGTRLKNELNKKGIEVIGIIPDDPVIFEASFEGHPFGAGQSVQAAGKVLDFLLSKRKFTPEKSGITITLKDEKNVS